MQSFGVGECALQCLPKKVLEMYSDTWLPERLISDRWLSSLFSILLNWKKKKMKHYFKFETNISEILLLSFPKNEN